MNEKAKELGLTGTHYSNPVGLHEEETYTTVRDTFTLTKYALQYELFKELGFEDKILLLYLHFYMPLYLF